MRLSDVNEVFKNITKEYFKNATVIFAKESRAAKPKLSLITITPGNVTRHIYPNNEYVDGVVVNNYQSKIPMTVDLFTKGSPVLDDDYGQVIAYENTALEDLLSFADFLNSEYVTRYTDKYDITIILDEGAQDVTGLVNDTNYEYRARMTVNVFFTQKAIGDAGVLLERSIEYPTGEVDPETEEPVYTEQPPQSTTSDVYSSKPNDKQLSGESDAGSGTVFVEDEDKMNSGAKVVPKFEESSSNGGTKELSEKETGYFTEAEIKEEFTNG